MDIESLNEKLKNINIRIHNFFNGIEYAHNGDRGYQNLLEERYNIQEQINKILIDTNNGKIQ